MCKCRSSTWKFLIIALLMQCSCARTSKLNNVNLLQKSEDYNIEVFLDRIPEREYVEIAIVEDTHEWSWGATLNGRIESLKKQARRLGADAVIIKSAQGAEKTGAVYSRPGVTANTKETVASGIAIAWKESIVAPKGK